MAENFFNVSIKQFLDSIKKDLQHGIYSPVIGIGAAGIGKTAGIHELAEELGIGYKEMRLVNHTETDLIGIPYDEYNDKDSAGVHRTKFAANNLLPIAEVDGPEGILVLDEITSCAPNIRALALQLLDSSRRVGDYVLPEKWKIIVLGNGADDGAVNYQGLEFPVINRTECYRITIDYDCWRDWANKHGVNKSVIAFLNFTPGYFAQYPSIEDDSIATLPTPRSWTELSTKLNVYEGTSASGILEESEVEMIAKSRVGLEAGQHFVAFYKYNNKTMSAVDLINGKLDINSIKFDTLDQQVIHLLSQGCISALNNLYNANGDMNASFSLLSGSNVTDESVLATSRVIQFALRLGSSKSIDVAINMLSQLARSCDVFRNIVLFDDRIEEQNPEFRKFYTENSIIFDTKALEKAGIL